MDSVFELDTSSVCKLESVDFELADKVSSDSFSKNEP